MFSDVASPKCAMQSEPDSIFAIAKSKVILFICSLKVINFGTCNIHPCIPKFTFPDVTLVQFNDVLVVLRAIYIVSVRNITERGEKTDDEKSKVNLFILM